MRYPALQPRTVLVTGCSTGIGAAAARLLRDAGWQVFPTARKPEDLAALESDGFTPIHLDMTDSESVQNAAATALDLCNGELGALVNNAGYGQSGAIEDIPRDAMRAQFETNVFGMQELTNCLIPVFRRRGQGRIVNVSSVVGRIAIPFNGVYSATKFAMEALSDILRVELDGAGIAVSLIEPGPVVTNFRKTAVEQVESAVNLDASPFAAIYRRELPRKKENPYRDLAWSRPPSAVAEKIRHALESSRPKRRYCITMPAYAGAILRRIAPDALVDHFMTRALRKKLAAASPD